MARISWLKVLSFLLCFCLIASYNQVKLVKGPQNNTVIEGDSVTLRCVVEHIPANVSDPVLWTKDGYIIGSDRDLELYGERYSITGDVSIGEYNLQIVNVTADDDDGFYRCQVPEYSKISTKARLTVLVPPKGPYVDGGKEKDGVVKVDAVVGQEMDVACKAINAKPAATLTWFKDGALQDRVKHTSTEVRNGLLSSIATLRLTPSRRDIGARYSCVMTSEAIRNNRFVAKVVQLNLIETPVAAKLVLPEIAKEGALVKAECSGRLNAIVTYYRWYVNDVLQDVEEPINTLGPTNRTWNQAKIACQACNIAGCSKLTKERLNVVLFVGEIDNKVAEIGDNVVLRCNWDSNPRPSIRWTRKGTEEILGTGAELIIRRAEQKDTGKYICSAVAANVGANFAETEVVVNGPPIFGNAKIQYSHLGNSATVTCELNSFPGIETVEWSWISKGRKRFLGGNEIRVDAKNEEHEIKFRGEFEKGERVAILKINSVNLNDLRSYACNASNVYGWKKQSITLEEEAGPSTESQHSSVDFVVIGSVIGGAAFLLVVVLVAVRVSRKRKRRADENKAKNLSSDRPTATNRNNYEEYPASPGDNCYHVTTSSTFHATTPPSTVFGSDDTNTTAHPSANDDGYSTGENNSWNRKSATPVNNPSDVGSVSYLSGPEKVDLRKPLLSQQSDAFADGGKAHLHPLTTFQPQHVQLPYDPTAVVNAANFRSASAYPGSSFLRNTMPRNCSETCFQPSVSELYNRAQTPLGYLDGAQVHIGRSSYVGRVSDALNPVILQDCHRYAEFPACPSQSSMDLPLGASAVETFNIPGRASNLSRGSQSSDNCRPVISKMATHV